MCPDGCAHYLLVSAALCMQRRAFDYLIKPIDLGHLSRAIHHALQRRHTYLEGQQVNQWLKDGVAVRVAERRLEQANQERACMTSARSVSWRKSSTNRGRSLRQSRACQAARDGRITDSGASGPS